jgi:hypothetical protein
VVVAMSTVGLAAMMLRRRRQSRES